MHIVIPDDYQAAVCRLECFARFQAAAAHPVIIYQDPPANVEALVERLYPAEALVLIRERTALSAGLLARLPNLKVISQTGKVSGHIDLAACQARGIAVLEGTGSGVSTAELCWALILADSRRLPQYQAALRAARWQQTGSPQLGRSLKGLTLGIWGFGRIGRLVAGYGRAFGMQVLVWGREPSRLAAEAEGLRAAFSQAEFFAASDVLSLHLRLNPATRGCVTTADLMQMKPDALFVNTSRAELVAPGALEAALAAGRPGGAALDVFESEPVLDPAHPLLRMENVLCTPHLGYVEQASYEMLFGAAFDNLLASAARQ